MTIAARMRIETGQDGRQMLVGSLLHSLDRGALIHLRRDGETYNLVALTGDGRRGDNSRESLGSFVLFDEEIPQLPEPDPLSQEYQQMESEGRV